MRPRPLPIHPSKVNPTLPAKLKTTLEARHMVTALVLLNPPPTQRIRTPLTRLQHHALPRLLRKRLLGIHPSVELRTGEIAVRGIRHGRVIEAVRVAARLALEDGAERRGDVDLARGAPRRLAPVEVRERRQRGAGREAVEAGEESPSTACPAL